MRGPHWKGYPMQLTTSETLDLAADLIEKRGWAQASAGMLVDGPHCIQGAIQAAAGGKTQPDYQGRGDAYRFFDTDPCPAGDAVMAYLEVTSAGVWAWNDYVYRTAPEVIEVLRA